MLYFFLLFLEWVKLNITFFDMYLKLVKVKQNPGIKSQLHMVTSPLMPFQAGNSVFLVGLLTKSKINWKDQQKNFKNSRFRFRFWNFLGGVFFLFKKPTGRSRSTSLDMTHVCQTTFRVFIKSIQLLYLNRGQNFFFFYPDFMELWVI